MKTALFLSNFDTTFTSNDLAPTYTRNLCLRNGIFYFRRMIKGKRYLRSLHTSDPDLARYLVRQILDAEFNVGAPKKNLQKNKKIFVCFSKHVSQNSSYITTGPEVSAPITCDKRRNDMAGITNVKQAIKKNKVKTNAMDFWANKMRHKPNAQYDRDTKRLQNLMDNMDSPYLEDLEQDPLMIHAAIRRLEAYRFEKGAHKGEVPSKKYVQETIKVLKRIVNEARKQKVIETKGHIFEEIEDVDLAGFKPAVERRAFGEEKFKTLFTTMYEMKNGVYRTINDAIADEKYKNVRANLVHVRDNFEHYYYMILLLLFTGARANAIATLRLRDIYLKENLIWIHKDQKLIKSGDVREAQKKLKTEGAERKVPIADILHALGFSEFVKAQLKKFGANAFLFEKIVQNKNKAGFRVKTANENLNKLFLIAGFKDCNFMQDVHSLKHSFYTSNMNRAGKTACEAIAGQAHSGQGLSVSVYTNMNYDNASEEMIEAVNKLTFPYIDILFGKHPDSARKHNNGGNNGQNDKKTIASQIMNQDTKKVVKLVSDPVGLEELAQEDKKRRILAKQYEQMGFSGEAASIMATQQPQGMMGMWPAMPVWRP